MTWKRHGEWSWLVGAAAAGVLAMGLLGVAEARAYTAMHDYARQVEALSRFDAPPGWRSRTVRTEASETPGATRVWEVTGGFEHVRTDALAAFTAWSGPGSVVTGPSRVPEYAVSEARRGRDRAELTVVSDPDRPGFVRVELTASRLPPWQS